MNALRLLLASALLVSPCAPAFAAAARTAPRITISGSATASAVPTLGAPAASAVGALTPSAPSLAVPSLAAAAAAPRAQAPVAPEAAAVPAAQDILAQAAALPAAEAPSAQLAGAPFDGAGKPKATPPVAGSESAPADLAPSAPRPSAWRSGVPYQSWPDAGPRHYLSDRYHHARLYWQNISWYTVTHIKGMWPSYMKRRAELQAKGDEPSVSSARTFFSWMRVMGQTGPFYVLGFGSRDEDAVIAEATRAFDHYFDGPGVDAHAREAFVRFTQRAKGYNAEKRAPTNMRKHVRDAMISASLKPGKDLAAHFDALLLDDKTKATEDFQKSGQAAALLEQYRQAVIETVLEEDPKAADRVVGVILLGSFASGSPTPTSDFDTQPITANGGDTKVAAFRDRVLARWASRQKDNPVSIQDFPYPPSKTLMTRIHDGAYLIISPEEGLVAALERRPGEKKVTVPRELTLKGRLQRALQFGVVYATTLYADLKSR